MPIVFTIYVRNAVFTFSVFSFLGGRPDGVSLSEPKVAACRNKHKNKVTDFEKKIYW
jgi:hypothetical protein